MSNIDKSRRDNYRDRVLPAMSIDQLMDALQHAAAINSYGSHDDQINLIRGEIADRTHAEANPDNIIDPASHADTISLDEAVILSMFGSDDIDETNAHLAFRRGRKKLSDEMNTHRHSGVDDETAFSAQLDYDIVDSIVILATRNGGESLFDLKR